jgi:hypothetical protein
MNAQVGKDIRSRGAANEAQLLPPAGSEFVYGEASQIRPHRFANEKQVHWFLLANRLSAARINSDSGVSNSMQMLLSVVSVGLFSARSICPM